MNNQQPNIEPALERNRAFAAAGGHEGAVVFPNLRLFVITCLDPRVDPAHFLGLGLSDAMVVRNVGGRVTPEVINDVAFIGQLAENALPDGPLFEAAVIHHTQCGSGALADDTFRHRYAERIGAEDRPCASTPSSTPRRPSPATSSDSDLRLDLRAGRGVRACLRRGHWPGGDRRPRQRLRSSKQRQAQSPQIETRPMALTLAFA